MRADGPVAWVTGTLVLWAGIAGLAQAAPDPAVLAAGCAGCHPVSAKPLTPVTRLVGKPAAEIAEAMLAYRSGARTGTIMIRIAKGMSDADIQSVARYLSAVSAK